MKNYLVVLTGLPRGGEKTWTTLKKNVLEPLDADLAICTENNIDKSTNLYSMADYLCIINLMNKMFLMAILAHIRGLIKPNRVELWLILSQRVLSYQSGPRDSVLQLPGTTTILPWIERGSRVRLHPPLESRQLSANQRPEFCRADQ